MTAWYPNEVLLAGRENLDVEHVARYDGKMDSRAEDEVSLTADVIMRVEDARALATPRLVWSLPAIFLYGDSLGWWNAVALALVVAGALALCLIEMRTAGVGTMARRSLATR